jgi:hypothetical protein
MPLEIEHILPQIAGGSSDEANLCLACPRCNRYKGAQIHAMDPETANSVAFFIHASNSGKRILPGSPTAYTLLD